MDSSVIYFALLWVQIWGLERSMRRHLEPVREVSKYATQQQWDHQKTSITSAGSCGSFMPSRLLCFNFLRQSSRTKLVRYNRRKQINFIRTARFPFLYKFDHQRSRCLDPPVPPNNFLFPSHRVGSNQCCAQTKATQSIYYCCNTSRWKRPWSFQCHTVVWSTWECAFRAMTPSRDSLWRHNT